VNSVSGILNRIQVQLSDILLSQNLIGAYIDNMERFSSRGVLPVKSAYNFLGNNGFSQTDFIGN
jgi:hypothetical protein